MPLMGNELLAGGTGVSGGATLAGFFRRRAGEDFFFMRLFPSCVSGPAKAAYSSVAATRLYAGVCSLRCQNLVAQVAQRFLTETRMLQRLA
jgi:hypothetical protein